jgi:Uma2 family endonuclease
VVEPAQSYVSLEEFLVSEAADPSGVRREWVDGHVYAMAGATPEHGRITASVLAELRSALRGRCTVRDGSVAVHIGTTRAGLRPDVTVVSGPIMKTVVEKNGRVEGEAITNPCVIVEVLSDNTERDDRGWKFRDYRTLASLEEYVLVSQHERRIEVFRRAANWQAEVYAGAQSVVIHGAAIAIDAIYDE